MSLILFSNWSCGYRQHMQTPLSYCMQRRQIYTQIVYFSEVLSDESSSAVIMWD